LLDTEVEGKQLFPKIGKYHWRKKLVIKYLNFKEKGKQMSALRHVTAYKYT